MNNRPDRRIFRRRRRRAGLVLFTSLGILLLGGLLISGLVAVQAMAASTPVERVKSPLLASAPDAVEQVEEEEQPDQAMVEEEAVAKDQAAKKKTAENEAAEEKKAEKKAAKEKKEKKAEKKKAEEKAAAQAQAEPAAPPPPKDKTMYLTVPKMGLYSNVVYNSSDPTTMDVGAVKLEETGFPWQDSANPYISAHRLGWPGTASYYQFYNLPLMAYGDVIYLTDANGTTYTYEVTEIFEVAPNEVWISNPVAGRDMISLQTCTEDYGDYWTMGPDWATRYVVRGDRIDVSYA